MPIAKGHCTYFEKKIFGVTFKKIFQIEWWNYLGKNCDLVKYRSNLRLGYEWREFAQIAWNMQIPTKELLKKLANNLNLNQAWTPWI